MKIILSCSPDNSKSLCLTATPGVQSVSLLWCHIFQSDVVGGVGSDLEGCYTLIVQPYFGFLMLGDGCLTGRYISP